MNQGKTVFAQLMTMIPEYEFDKCVARYKGNYRVRNFSCRDHFYVMSFAQLTHRESLRDIEDSLNAFSNKLYHSGIKHAVPRNTLAKANELRNWRIYADFAAELMKIAKLLYQNDKDFRLELDNMVYAFDSSTISLCLKLCPWATFRKHKGGVKLHTLLDIRSNIPIFVHLTNAAIHDVKILDELPIEPAAFYVMDKGYVDFFRLFNLIHTKRAFFVTRAKENMAYNVINTKTVDNATGVVYDQLIQLTGVKTAKQYPDPIRLVCYEDFATNNVYRFLTNNTDLPAITIAELYRERWNVEMFFKWVKQHLRIKSFYGTSENAVYCQIWIAVSTFLLVAIAKKRMKVEQSPNRLVQTIGLSLFERKNIKELFDKSKNISLITNCQTLFSINDF